MKRILPLFALLAAPAFAQDAAPAAEAPAAPAAEAPAAPRYAAPAPAHRVALPPVSPEAIDRVMPRGPKFDRLPPDEKEHIRKMAEYGVVRADAERELLELDKAIEARRAEILEQNEEAKALAARIDELQEEYAAATNALETLLREDESLAGLVAKARPARLIVESSQYAINAEVAVAMGKRMAAMRKAYEEKQATERAAAAEAAAAEETADAAGEPPAAAAVPQLPERPAATIDPKDAPSGTVPGASPDIKPPLAPRVPAN